MPGSSFGGFVAQYFGPDPDRVRRLILANTDAPGSSPLPALGMPIPLFANYRIHTRSFPE